MLFCWGTAGLRDIKWKCSLSLLPDIRHPEELSLLRKPRDPKKKKKKLEEVEEDDLELEGPLLTPGSGELFSCNSHGEQKQKYKAYTCKFHAKIASTQEFRFKI